MKIKDKIRSWRRDNTPVQTRDPELIPIVVIEKIILEKDNEPIVCEDSMGSGDCCSPEEALEISAFEREMKELGFSKIDTGLFEIKELDFSRLDAISRNLK